MGQSFVYTGCGFLPEEVLGNMIHLSEIGIEEVQSRSNSYQD